MKVIKIKEEKRERKNTWNFKNKLNKLNQKKWIWHCTRTYKILWGKWYGSVVAACLMSSRLFDITAILKLGNFSGLEKLENNEDFLNFVYLFNDIHSFYKMLSFPAIWNILYLYSSLIRFFLLHFLLSLF